VFQSETTKNDSSPLPERNTWLDRIRPRITGRGRIDGSDTPIIFGRNRLIQLHFFQITMTLKDRKRNQNFIDQNFAVGRCRQRRPPHHPSPTRESTSFHHFFKFNSFHSVGGSAGSGSAPPTKKQQILGGMNHQHPPGTNP
jgi:hypothetical protein